MKKHIEQEVGVVPTLMAYFSLGMPIEILPVKEGVSNHNYLVKTMAGEYIARFLMNQKLENVENDVAIQNQLKQGGINAPAYLQNADGAYIFQERDIKAVISRKIDGVIPRKSSPPLVHEFGRILAAFHACVTELPYPNDTGLMNPKVSGIQSEIFSHALPNGIIHGDFHLGNALVDSRNPDRIIAMLDFEEAGENLFLVDLAVTIMGVCFSTDDNVIDFKRVQAAIKGYQAIRALTHAEKSLFPQAVEYAAEAWIKWFSEHGYERYAEKHQGRLNSFRGLDCSQLFDASDG